jgi:hypothetical protein
MASNIAIAADSDVVREQIITVHIDPEGIHHDVDTVRVVIQPAQGRARSLLFSRDALSDGAFVSRMPRKGSGTL